MRLPVLPQSNATMARLFAGGAAGLFIWEIWARVLTKAVLGFPLEPAGLIDAIMHHQFGIAVPWLLREAMHYVVGVAGYPIVYFLISRNIRNWGFVLDVVTAVTFAAGALWYVANGKGDSWTLVFLIVVLAFIATRFVNANASMREAISWGTFTWFNALGLMAPLGGLSFYLLGDSVALSFMSFAGHVIYGAGASLVFEKLNQAQASTG